MRASVAIPVYGIVAILGGLHFVGSAQPTLDPVQTAARDARRDASAFALAEARIVAEATHAAAAAEAESADRIAGFHCLSGWNGANRDMIWQVIAAMPRPR